MAIPKRVTKKALKSWLYKRTFTKKDKLMKELNAEIQQRTAPIISTMFRKYDPLQRAANVLLDHVQSYVQDHGGMTGNMPYTRREVITNLSSAFCGIIKDHERVVHQSCINYVYRPTDHFNSGSEALDVLVEELVVEFRQAVADIVSIEPMWMEIEAVISAAPSGKRAYRDLIALGIDLTDYAAIHTLPAVVKLSGDVELINKG